MSVRPQLYALRAEQSGWEFCALLHNKTKSFLLPNKSSFT